MEEKSRRRDPHKRKRDESDDGQKPKKRKLSKEAENGKKSKKKKDSNVVKVSEKEENVPLSNFRISEKNIETLTENGITSLFPIQSKTFDFVYEGKDLIGRARTGTGKTLSFSLPIIEKLLHDNTRRQFKGPIVCILAPTRELAKQVESVVQLISQRLTTTCIYGGVPYSTQENLIRNGLDIVVGTPGRIMDFLEKGTLNFRELKYFVLDEADIMLDMGFRDDIEKIMSYVPKNQIQTLLYSATIPEWVSTVANTFLKPDYVTVDLVGTEDVQTSTTVKHLAIMTNHRERLEALADVVGVYSKGGKTMIFCDTKNKANELALSSSISASCQVLHGDIAQKQREITLKSFRDGLFKILVATDVAARGLDINDVDLIIQCQPPTDVKTYIHRSGRTGRAGKSGVSLTFYTRREEQLIKIIEKQTGIQFQRVGMPQAKDIYRVSAEMALDDISKVNEEMYKHFLPYAKQCIEDHSGDFERALSSALAVIGGHLKIVKGRSLLSSLEGYTAVLVKAIRGTIKTKSYVLKFLSSDLEEHIGNDKHVFKEIKLTKEGGALVDMPTNLAEILIKNNSNHSYSSQFSYSIPTELPELEDEDEYNKRLQEFNSNYGSSDSGYSNNSFRGGRRNSFSGRSYSDFNSTRRNAGRGGFRGNKF